MPTYYPTDPTTNAISFYENDVEHVVTPAGLSFAWPSHGADQLAAFGVLVEGEAKAVTPNAQTLDDFVVDVPTEPPAPVPDPAPAPDPVPVPAPDVPVDPAPPAGG